MQFLCLLTQRKCFNIIHSMLLLGETKNGRWFRAVVQEEQRWTQSSGDGDRSPGSRPNWIVRRLLLQDSINTTNELRQQ